VPTVPANLIAGMFKLDILNAYYDNMRVKNYEDIAEFLSRTAPLRVNVTPQRKEGLPTDLVNELL
jgi:hypothetical protein